MTVTATPRDKRGAELDTRITNLGTSAGLINASLSPGARATADAAVRQAQVEAVDYYMSKGRLNPATILSTLS